MKLAGELSSWATRLDGYYPINGRNKGFNKRVYHILIASAALGVIFILAISYVFFHPQEPPPSIESPRPLIDDGPNRPKYHQWNTASEFRPVSQDVSDTTSIEELCRSFPRHLTDHMIQPVLKMGHNEKRDRVEAQLESVSACIDDLLVVSDAEETLYGHEVIDVIAELPAAYNFENDDFVNYTRIHNQYQKNREKTSPNEEAPPTLDGWLLDKYKFLPMIERAWLLRPNKRWYFFYETDTYVVWDNVFRFLGNLDHNQPLYMGSPSPGRRATPDKPESLTYFANGGPGFVLSRAAVKQLLDRKSGKDGDFIEESLSRRWMDLLRVDPCGDSVLGWALHNVGVHLSGYFPLFNPHPLHGVPFDEGHWCQPGLTMHKTKIEDMRPLWRWEHSRRVFEVSHAIPLDGWFDLQHANNSRPPPNRSLSSTQISTTSNMTERERPPTPGRPPTTRNTELGGVGHISVRAGRKGNARRSSG